MLLLPTTFTREQHQKMHRSIRMQQTAPVLFVPGFSFTNSQHLKHTGRRKCRSRVGRWEEQVVQVRSLHCVHSTVANHITLFWYCLIILIWKEDYSLLHQKNNRAAASPFSVLFTFSIWASLLPKGFLLDEVEESWAATGQRFLLLSNTAAKLKHHSPSSAGFFWRPKGKEVEE